MNRPSVIRCGVLDMQVCVPASWDDEQVQDFAESMNPSGVNGWHVRKDAELLAGCPERNPCVDREAFVHVALDC